MTARTSHVVLVAIASLALGVLIGALVAGGIDDVMASAPPMSPASPAGAPEAVPPPSIASPRLDAAPPSELRVLASAAARGKDLPVAPAAKTDDASGDAGVEASAVTGSIATLDGSPVAGVELELEPPEDAPKYRVRRATSDASGRFEFSGLPRGVWRVIGRHREYVLQRRNAFPELVPTGYHVELVASPAVTVDVRVTGEGAERARVAFRRPGSGEPEWSTWTSTSTVLALSPGAWELCASVDALDDWPSDRSWKLAPLASPVRTVHVGGGEAEVVTLLLEGARCLYGKVRLPEGHQSSDSHDTEPRVRLIEARTGTRADFETEDDRLTRSAEVDEEGRYGFFALPYERWTAGVALRWSSPGTVDVVDVVGLTRFDLEESIDGDGSVVVDAFTSGGHRITVGISFSFIHRDAGDGSDDYRWQGARTVLDADGALRVTPLPLDKDEREEVAKKDELLLRATLPGFARIDQPLAGLTGERFRLTFVPGAELEVVLVGDGAERAMRKCNGELKGEEYHDWVSFDEGAGALTFAGLLPGTYTLTVSTWGSYDGGWRQVRLHHGEVDVRAGSQRIEVQMPVRADLVVRCPGVKKDVGALLYGPLSEPVADREETWRRTRANAKVDDFGQATFKDIAAGRYRLTIGQRMQLVTVPCPPVDFEGRIPERHYFSLEKGDSPLRRAGIRSGDVYVALDGEEVTSQAALTRIRELSSQSAGTLRVTVERDGRWVEFTLDAAALGEDESFATQLEPMLE